jgi:hypothetical protein
MKRLLALLFTIALSSCATYDSYGYRDDGYYQDRYYSGGRYYYDDYARYDSYWDYPDYVYWSDYYSVLWPVYRGYYDPFYTPGFYYGVTWYPRTYFGLNHYWNSWPYYHSYSPYRYSYWDGYYDHWDRRRGQVGRRVAHGYGANVDHPYMYGSARNEAEQLARRSGAAYQRSPGQPGLQYDPYAAQRTGLPGRDPVRGHYPDRGLQPQTRMNGAVPTDQRSRDVLRRTQGGVPARQVQPYGEPAPSRARDYDRGNQSFAPAQQSDGRRSGWVSDTAAQQPAESGYSRQRSTPYFREVGGTQVPMTRRPSLDSSFERALPRRGDGIETRSLTPENSAYAGSRSRQQPYSYRQTAPTYQPIQRSDAPQYQRYEPSAPRQQAPQREVFQQSAPRYQAAQPRYEAPQRSAPVERSRPERSESSGSARDEIRRSRDDD